LWVDDDDPDRFMLERVMIETDFRAELHWAESIDRASQLLARKRFDAAILDQMLSGPQTPMPAVPWGGCALLHWLCRKPLPLAAGRDWKSLDCRVPLPSNIDLPAVFVSGFDDSKVWAATQEASPRIQLLRKPLAIGRLATFLRQAFT
jgi:hypothetical protein